MKAPIHPFFSLGFPSSSGNYEDAKDLSEIIMFPLGLVPVVQRSIVALITVPTFIFAKKSVSSQVTSWEALNIICTAPWLPIVSSLSIEPLPGLIRNGYPNLLDPIRPLQWCFIISCTGCSVDRRLCRHTHMGSKKRWSLKRCSITSAWAKSATWKMCLALSQSSLSSGVNTGESKAKKYAFY